MTNPGYDVFDVARPGGRLRVGRWGNGATYVIAAHGVTANHVSFSALADQLPDDITLVAPDLRGRGGSYSIGGPFGMEAHADDIVAILDHLGVASATVVGHSMGGFVAVVAAERHPQRVNGVVLVDGGLPIELGPLAQLPIEVLVERIIGPSLKRLSMRFASAEAYLDYWRLHPALRDHWNDYLEAYLRYDLVGSEPELRSGVSREAVLADSQSDLLDGVVDRALMQLRQPTVFLRAPRGLLDAEPLFAEETVARWQRELPALITRTVPGVNHYTIVLSERGSEAVAKGVCDVGAMVRDSRL